MTRPEDLQALPVVAAASELRASRLDSVSLLRGPSAFSLFITVPATTAPQEKHALRC